MKGDAMSIREIRNAAFSAGWNAASWVDMPEIGDSVPRWVDWQGIGTIETRGEAIDAWETVIMDNLRGDQSAERAAIAYAINARETEYGEGEAESGWENWCEFNLRGIRAYRVKHYPMRQRHK